MKHELKTSSPESTERVGAALAGYVERGLVVALYGDLATGKTCLTRGMAGVFGAKAGVHSPTFTLVNRYGEERSLLHLDLYRLNSPSEVADLGYEELFDPEGVCVVEWAERAEGLLPPRRIDVRLRHLGGDERGLVFEWVGLEPDDACVRALEAAAAGTA